jgi:hypothetical protein
MKRPLAVSAFIVLTACGETQQSCDDLVYDPSTVQSVDPRSLAVPSANSGPGKITFVNSNPDPGSSMSGCGPTVAGCAGRLKVVFNVRPDVNLVSQRLRVTFSTADEARLTCSSTTFDLDAGQTFAIQVECPGSASDVPTPFRTATMMVETGAGPARIEQDWKVPYSFLP